MWFPIRRIWKAFLLLKNRALLFLLKAGIVLTVFSGRIFAQHFTGQQIVLRFDDTHPDIIRFRQKIRITGVKAGDTLYLYNWLQAYADIHSGLGKAIEGRYKLHFNFSSKKERGFLRFRSQDSLVEILSRDEIIRLRIRRKHPDTLALNLQGTIKLPSRDFTGYGYGKKHYDLRAFLLQPADPGRLYTNKNLDDRPVLPVPTEVSLVNYPEGFYWESNGRIRFDERSERRILISFPSTFIKISARTYPWRRFRMGNTTLVLDSVAFPQPDRFLENDIVLPVMLFLWKNKIPLPEKMLVTSVDLKRNPVYDIGWLPLMRPYPEKFRLQLKLLKQLLTQAFDSYYWDRRKNFALTEGIKHFYLLKFIRENASEIPLAGQWKHLSFLHIYRFFRIPYAGKYPLALRYIYSMNKDQALCLPADSLLNFNRWISAPYKMALGLDVRDRLQEDGSPVRPAIEKFLQRSASEPVGLREFKKLLNDSPSKFLWGDFYRTVKKPHYRFRLRKTGKDSVRINLHNLNGLPLPVSFEILDKQHRVVQEKHLPPFRRDTVLTLAYNPGYAYVFNRNNPLPGWQGYATVLPRRRKPLLIRPVSDVYDPFARQIFINPDMDFNLYDGLILGAGINNHTLLDRPFEWEVTPEWAFKSRTLTGTGSVQYLKHFDKPRLNSLSLKASFDIHHYNRNLFYRSFVSSVKINFKNRAKKLLRGNTLSFYYFYVNKDIIQPSPEARYGVFRINDEQYKKGFLHRYNWINSLEINRRFIKLQTEFRYRFFMDKYRQFEWRTFAGYMPYNASGTDYFSFSLSRPTDYLFRYKYYGRSETSGIFARQYVYAEGAFKIMYADQYANRWMIVNNINIGIWKRLNAFVDFGWMQSRMRPVVFHYDAGLRYYFIPDFFEVYFPLLNDGQIIKPNRHYVEKIRIMFVFGLPELAKMFTRSWY